ncbi:MAG: hypothetical protein LUD47_07160, partial [Clostridia bacterium]|nr:hypothetical protein [Clostridia bacterium]
GMHRYYIEDLSIRDYLLEGSSPYRINICGSEISDASWGNFVCKVVRLLLKNFPERRDHLIAFNVQWGNADIFSSSERTNFKWVDDNIYMNCNQTALHLCWLLQDLLDYFDINRSNLKMLIHKPVNSEPKKIKAHIESVFIIGFKSYLCRTHPNTSEASAEKVIQNIQRILNPMLVKNSRFDSNFFLFDDFQRLSKYISKVQEYMSNRLNYADRDKKILNKCLKYLKDFYTL